MIVKFINYSCFFIFMTKPNLEELAEAIRHFEGLRETERTIEIYASTHDGIMHRQYVSLVGDAIGFLDKFTGPALEYLARQGLRINTSVRLGATQETANFLGIEVEDLFHVTTDEAAQAILLLNTYREIASNVHTPEEIVKKQAVQEAMRMSRIKVEDLFFG